MNQKAYTVLEYHKIIGLLCEKAASPTTKDLIRELKPSVDVYQIKEWITETTEAVSVIMRKGALPLGAFYDTSDTLRLAEKGAVLTMKQLLEILYNLQAARTCAQFLKSDLPDLVRIKDLAYVLCVEKHLEAEIDRCIISEEEMADHASSELRQIRRQIVRHNEAIRAKMNSILSSSDSRNLMQDAIVTMRQGRYVIPVKQENKTRFPGIVHDQSQSGATLFIEPQAIVNMNNELRELELAEKKEMHRILSELSAQAGAVSQQLINNQRILSQLDFIFAKGKLSADLKGAPPEINESGYLRIKQGRHPLIDPKKVVPINVSLGKDYETLVVTGPNTGGKTVTLKTVGLFALMAQSGLHVPAAYGTQLPIFHSVYADIGDEQSIEQSLSTFSSHMKNIVQIVAQADHQSLVLLDELGAGTDPTEGAALAISILENVAAKGAKTMATTHYTELKKYALSTRGVENASMEFDVETLSPTYKLSIGVPGRSNAFEISQKLGLPETIIQQAKGLLEHGDIQFEEVIAALQEDRQAAEEERDEAMLLNLEMKRQKEVLDRQQEKFKEQKEKILARAREEAQEMVKEAREFTEQIQKELRELEKLEDPSERNRRLERARIKVRDQGGKYKEKIKTTQNFDAPKVGELKLGDRVNIITLGQKGNVLTLPDDKGDLMVQVGLLKISANLKDMTKVQENVTKKEKEKARYGAMYRAKSQQVGTSINVIGQNLDEASMAVDKYLDDAFMAGLSEVTIVHGRGAGILRDGLSQMLRHHKHVAKFRKGSYNEGSDGATIVTLK